MGCFCWWHSWLNASCRYDSWTHWAVSMGLLLVLWGPTCKCRSIVAIMTWSTHRCGCQTSGRLLKVCFRYITGLKASAGSSGWGFLVAEPSGYPCLGNSLLVLRYKTYISFTIFNPRSNLWISGNLKEKPKFLQKNYIPLCFSFAFDLG